MTFLFSQLRVIGRAFYRDQKEKVSIIQIWMINKQNLKSEEVFLMSVCYKTIIKQLITHCSDTKNHIFYHVPLPTKLRRLLIDVIRTAITCQIIENEHHIDIMCDILLREPMFSHKKIEAIIVVLQDVFQKITIKLS